MTVTLNFTSKGLIDAIQRQLAQQKSEGKISGDISYSKIATCSFWDAIDIINKKHKAEKKSLVFHGKSYTCDDKEQNTNWSKTMVVYGSVTLEDDEWKTLVNAMGLELTSNKAKEEKPEESNVQQPTSEKKGSKDFTMKTNPMGTLLAKLSSNKDLAKYVQVDSDGNIVQTNLIVYASRIAQNEGYKFTVTPDRKFEIKKDGITINEDQFFKALFKALEEDPTIRKVEATDETTVTNAELDIVDDESCTEDEVQ